MKISVICVINRISLIPIPYKNTFSATTYAVNIPIAKPKWGNGLFQHPL